VLSQSTKRTIISDDVVFDVGKDKNTRFINEELLVFHSTISKVTIQSFTSFTQCGVGSYPNIFSISLGITLYNFTFQLPPQS